jgi:hypothetical protein
VGQEKEFPDLVLEIALTSGGLDIALIEQCVSIRSGRQTRRAFRAGCWS